MKRRKQWYNPPWRTQGYDCDVNLIGLINVPDACRKVNVEQFLMPSSAAVYGDWQYYH